MKITDKLEPKDRGLVREVKILKKDSPELADNYKQAAQLVKNADVDLNKAIVLEQQLRTACNNTAAQISALSESFERIIANKGKIKALALSVDPNTTDPALVAQLQTFNARLASVIVEEEVAKTDMELLRTKWDKQKGEHDKSLEYLQLAKDNLKGAKTVQSELLERGKKFADEDLESALKEIEEVRILLRYVKWKMHGQTKTHWVFLLIQPEEFEGDVQIKEEQS